MKWGYLPIIMNGEINLTIERSTIDVFQHLSYLFKRSAFTSHHMQSQFEVIEETCTP